MSKSEFERVKKDVEVIKQAVGLELPFGWDSVLFNFNCAQYYRTERSHDRPILDHEAVKWLVEEKQINLVGSDASGIELKGVPNQPNHQFLMDNERPIIEFAAHLDTLKKERFTLFALALSIQGLDSCPVRLVALEEE